MKFSQIVLVVLLSAVVSLGVVQVAGGKGAGSAAPAKETAFERVMRTNTLRCGYVILPPQLSRDPNTGAFGGITFDLLDEAAKRLGLKVEWTEEVTFPTMAEGLKTGRYDSFCLTAYRWLPAARAMDFTAPIFYSTTEVYARADDDRFDADVKAVNDDKISVAVIDGESGFFIKEQDFPLAHSYAMPVGTDMASMFEAVAARKADVAFANPLMAMPYLVANPGKIKRVSGQKPLRVYAHALAFGKGERDLESMFDLAFDEMQNDGLIDRILDKYEAVPNSFVRIKSVVQ